MAGRPVCVRSATLPADRGNGRCTWYVPRNGKYVFKVLIGKREEVKSPVRKPTDGALL